MQEKDKITTEEQKKQLGDCEKKAAEYLAGWQRERADFLNYKKEEMERIGQLINYAKEELVLEILPIMDNFEAAEKNLTKKDENPDGKPSASYGASIKGILQIKIQFQNFLKGLGVEEIKSLGEKFDPALHEIVEQVEPFDVAQGKEKGKESGTIIEEIQKGYKSNGRLLRPAKVRVTK